MDKHIECHAATCAPESRGNEPNRDDRDWNPYALLRLRCRSLCAAGAVQVSVRPCPAIAQAPNRCFRRSGRVGPSFALVRTCRLVGVWEAGFPLLFEWRVVGERGCHFVAHKFRTMVRNAKRMQATLAAQNEMTGPVFEMRQDSRVTRVGRGFASTALTNCLSCEAYWSAT